MLVHPSSGSYFLLAVILHSGNKAQGFGDTGNETHASLDDPANETHEPSNETHVYPEDSNKAQEFGNEPLPVCRAEVCVRKCCPVGEVRPVCNKKLRSSETFAKKILPNGSF